MNGPVHSAKGTISAYTCAISSIDFASLLGDASDPIGIQRGADELSPWIGERILRVTFRPFTPLSTTTCAMLQTME
jgi:hypothetical protein